VLPAETTIPPAGKVDKLPGLPPAPSGGILPWSEVRNQMDWRQGEHVTIIGPTGQGKTTLALDLMDMRAERGGHPLIIATKPRDTTLERMRRGDWNVIRKWPPIRQKTILWPKMNRVADKGTQAAVIRDALDQVFIAGNYAVLIDELSYVIDELRCKAEITQIWQQGRALGISLVTCILRPSHVPLLAYDQATHIIMFRDNDETNLRRMGGLGHWSRAEIIDAVSQLERHQFLLLNTRNGSMIRSITDPKGT